MINAVLYKEDDSENYIFYLIKPLEEFNKEFKTNFKFEQDAVRYAINCCIEERDATECKLCKEDWDDDQTECDYYVCSMYLTQFIAEYGYKMQDYVEFENVDY